MIKKYPMTLTGKRKLEKELDYLKKEKQKEISDEIKYLRGFCDFSDDVFFSEMLKQQALLKERIREIENMLYNSELIQTNSEEMSTVILGSTVIFKKIPNGIEEKYTIVGTTDANPMDHKVSTESPIGKSLLGRKTNDKISIKTPSGEIRVKILNIY